MQRGVALNVVKATSRLRVLARHAREAAAAAAAEEEAAENGEHAASPNGLGIPFVHGGAGGDGGMSSQLESESLLGCSSPQSHASLALPQPPRSPLCDDASVASAALAMRSPLLTPRQQHHQHKVAQLRPWYLQDLVAVKEMLLSSWLNCLIIAVPLGLAAHLCGWGPVPVFVLNFLALIPLALMLGDVTEDLALRFGDQLGGLLNATFGNVVEMILSLAALRQGLYDVVASSLLGSILSNLLLVLGCCFLFGGARYSVQTFNATANQATSSLLLLSCIGIVLPTAAAQLSAPDDVSFNELLGISRWTAVIMLFVYGCYLVFQLRTHHHLFCAGEDDEQPVMTLSGALATLAGITVAVAACSEFLCGSIEAFSDHTGLSQPFLAIIVLPIAGNACEHITAVTVAMKNKMDLSLGVAVGSSIQIAIFAIPFAVVAGWVTGRDFTLDFDPFATLALTVSVIHANFVTSDARSHWLMGVALIVNYAVIALVFLYKS